MNNVSVLINADLYASVYASFFYRLRIYDNYPNLRDYKAELGKKGVPSNLNSEGDIIFLECRLDKIKISEVIDDNLVGERLRQAISKAWSNYMITKYVIKTSKREIKINLGCPLIMGILNITPDSFYDGGRHMEVDKAVEAALEMEQAGADIIDIGGQSTRPGSIRISAEEEIDRVLPVVSRLKKLITIPISIDTYYAKVADIAIEEGAEIVNDTSALTNDAEAMIDVIRKRSAAVCLMHYYKRLQPMPQDPVYKDIMFEIIEWLRQRVSLAELYSISTDRMIVDPGVGFGKTVDHNLQLINRLDEMRTMGLPILAGLSRKSFIGKVLSDTGPNERLSGTISSCVLAMLKGAAILRVHDVKEIKKAIKIANSVLTGA
jgi:dihydropteroate synthase